MIHQFRIIENYVGWTGCEIILIIIGVRVNLPARVAHFRFAKVAIDSRKGFCLRLERERSTRMASRVFIALFTPLLSMVFLLESLLLTLGEVILLDSHSVVFVLSAIKNDYRHCVSKPPLSLVFCMRDPSRHFP